ncbi:hypothetical protein U3516DRAFT_593429, partial [Neocallimastix sp. 'constans']
MDTFDENDNFISRYRLEFNYTTYLFNDFEEIKFIQNVKKVILCRTKDIDKSENDKNTIILWNTSDVSYFGNTIVYLSAFPKYLDNRKNNNIICMRVDAVGWYDNVNAEICNDNDESITCPDLIILGTTQFASRYNKDETLNLNKYYLKYYKETGKTIQSRLFKYTFYDYLINNNWLAFPISIDFRMFRYNETTFRNCIEKGYDLHYPPPISDYWGSNYQKTWTWEKVFEYAKIITNCTGKPGLRFVGSRNADLKMFTSVCHSLGIPFIVDDNYLEIKKCGLRNDEHIKKLYGFKNFIENHYIENWLDMTDIQKWLNLPYPSSVDKQYIFKHDKYYDDRVN